MVGGMTNEVNARDLRRGSGFFMLNGSAAIYELRIESTALQIAAFSPRQLEATIDSQRWGAFITLHCSTEANPLNSI